MANTLKFGNGEWYGKKDTILAYNDENSNFKPLPFSFDRASSATVINKDGLIETVGSGEPRIDFSNDAKGALLLEPTRSNSLVQSNQFDTNWIGSSTSVLSGYLGLDGTNSAWLLTKTASSFANIRQNITFSGIHTFSVYLKKGTNTSAVIRSTGGNDARVEINLIDGTTSGAVNTTSVLTESMGNDWWRCSMTLNASSNTAVRIYPEASLGGTTAGNIYMQYAQVEQGSYATSYIPTQGSAVTRVAESCNQTPPSDVIGQTEGTILVDVDFKTLSGTNMFVSIRPDASNKIEIYRSDAVIYAEFASNASFNFNKPSVTVGRYKIAVAYSSGSSAMYINGVFIGSNTTTFAFTSTLDDIYINSRGTSFIEQSNYNDFKLYNTRLSNAELQALTSN